MPGTSSESAQGQEASREGPAWCPRVQLCPSTHSCMVLLGLGAGAPHRRPGLRPGQAEASQWDSLRLGVKLRSRLCVCS